MAKAASDFAKRRNKITEETETDSSEEEFTESESSSKEHGKINSAENEVTTEEDEEEDISEVEEVGIEDENSSEYEEEEETISEEQQQNEVIKCEAIHDYENNHEGYLNFKKGDIMTVIERKNEHWLMVENANYVQGLVPYNHIKYLNEPSHGVLESKISDSSTRSGKDLWTGVKRLVRQTTATDVLSALGATPSGFRPSTLESYLTEDCIYTMECFLSPKLSKSKLKVRDLIWDSNNKMLKPVAAQIERCIRLISCKQIPLPGAGVEVFSRHIQMCLFDGVHVCSNITTVRAKTESQTSKFWNFSSKISSSTSCADDGDCFIRSNDLRANLGVLFEVCVTVHRQSSGETNVLSCGWAFLKLYDEVGLPVNSGTYNLNLHGGTPYEQGVAVDSSLIKSESLGSLKSIITRRHQPKLSVKLLRPKTEIKSHMAFLPPTLIGGIALLPFISIYRQLLAETLLPDRTGTYSAELIHSPVLRKFPSVVGQCDVMDTFRMAWMDKSKSLKRSLKAKPEVLKRLFISVFMENVFIFTAVYLPPFRLSDPQSLQMRSQVVEKIKNIQREKGPVAVFMQSDLEFEPLNISELAVDILGPHCEHDIELFCGKNQGTTSK